MHTKWCFCILFFFFISLKKVWKFGYLVFFARINFREFVLAKNFAGINFRKISQNLRNLRKLLSAKITSFKVYDSLAPTTPPPSLFDNENKVKTDKYSISNKLLQVQLSAVSFDFI